MTVVILHRKISPKVDLPDTALVRPVDWNDSHRLEMPPGIVGRRTDAGVGEPEELPIYVDNFGNVVFDMTGALRVPNGTEADRPAVPGNGMIRYNQDTGRLETYQNGIWVNLVVAPDHVVPTGTYIYTFAPGAMPGWVIAAGTIGHEGSGAENRANVDTLPLYKLLWENFEDTFCPVEGGRGAVAEEDFYALKYMQLPDLRETIIAGAGNMGSALGAPAPNNRLKQVADGTGYLVEGGFGDILVPGTFGGNKQHQLTILQLAAHKHTIEDVINSTAPTAASVNGGPWFNHSNEYDTLEEGGDKAHNNVQPTILLNALIKL